MEDAGDPKGLASPAISLSCLCNPPTDRSRSFSANASPALALSPNTLCTGVVSGVSNAISGTMRSEFLTPSMDSRSERGSVAAGSDHKVAERGWWLSSCCGIRTNTVRLKRSSIALGVGSSSEGQRPPVSDMASDVGVTRCAEEHSELPPSSSVRLCGIGYCDVVVLLSDLLRAAMLCGHLRGEPLRAATVGMPKSLKSPSSPKSRCMPRCCAH
mmetsp:Transcript_17275/g.40660  ORF Transcript_17275/g.40660 Transcript_17275/m.40660 type:complete len:214 (-) Transcript_17275:2600-3241(-)